MNYDELRLRTNTGWNTWYYMSMTAHVLLPYGFGILLGFKDFAEAPLIRNLKVGDCGLRPGCRSWDGHYTSLTFRAGKTDITVESTVRNGEQYILVTPEDHGAVVAPALAAETALLYGKPGCLWNRDGRIGTADPAMSGHVRKRSDINKQE